MTLSSPSQSSTQIGSRQIGASHIEMSLEERVLKIFKDVMELDGEVETKDLKYNEIANWTSLAHITLVSALEGEFDITMDPDDVLAMSSYDKAVEIVRKLAN
jgi:acyl carrier protein